MTDSRCGFALRAGRRGVDQERVRLAGVDQALARQLQGPDLGVHEVLGVARLDPDLVRVPGARELLALAQEQFDHPGGARAGRAEAGETSPDCGGEGVAARERALATYEAKSAARRVPGIARRTGRHGTLRRFQRVTAFTESLGRLINLTAANVGGVVQFACVDLCTRSIRHGGILRA
jgi:hypothetical protein